MSIEEKVELELTLAQTRKLFDLLEVLKYDRERGKLDPLTGYRFDQFNKALRED